MTTIRRAQLADAEPLARCHLAAWRNSYRPAISEQILANVSLDEYVAKWVARIGEPDCQVLIAQREPATIVGLLYGGPERSGDGEFAGEIYSIYVLADCRRQGVGRRLFDRFAEALLDAGSDSLLVWVFEQNPCRAAYAAWGGQPVARKPLTVGEQQLVEIAYGWPDLRGRGAVSSG